MTAAVIDVLLATYRGERFLERQIVSLRRQRYPALRFWARDDGSDDATPAILERWRASDPARVTVLREPRRNLGPAANFAALLAASRAPYAMFCDQDDEWDADKASVTLAAMLRAERDAPGSPVLVHTDLRLIDADGRAIAPSAWRRQRWRARPRLPLAEALTHNDGVTGCAAMINRPLARLALPLPDGIVMHDWYLQLLAVAFGRRVPVRRPTISYRLHGGNAVGVARLGPAYAGAIWRRTRSRHVLAAAIAQARALLHAHGPRLSDDDRRVIESFVRLPELGWADRRRSLLRHGFTKGDALRDVGLLALV